MLLSSTAFENNRVIPTRYARQGITGGKNTSIPLAWSGSPAEATSFALSIVDPHPVASNWVHWLVINLPIETRSLPEGASLHAMPTGAVELYNSFGERGYGGPQPPRGSGMHPYVVSLYALREATLDLGLNASLQAFKKTIEESLLARAILTGTFER